MQSLAAAVTMVRDDLFFLERWLDYYGSMFGRENLYVINHGRGEAVAEAAQGANVIGIPGHADVKFDIHRWRLLNNLVQGLRQYYKHVIVGDVDEIVVMDPGSGRTLNDFLERRPRNKVFSPVGLEVLHMVARESEPLKGPILGPRRFVRVNLLYAKPCVISASARLSRGGHYAEKKDLNTPDNLYLFHLKYCDFAQYAQVLDQRNELTQETGVAVKETTIGGHWFAENRGEDAEVFRAFEALSPVEGFDMEPIRAHMHKTWEKRGDGPFWHFENRDFGTLYELPERFHGVF
jgi:hypothetical protein